MGGKVRGQGVTLKGVMTIRKDGRVYRYLRRPGQPLVKLPDLDPSHPDFLVAYAKAVKVTAPPRVRAKPGSMAALIEAALASERLLSRATEYRAMLRRHLDAVREDLGDLPVRGLRGQWIRADVLGAVQPSARFKAWRFVCAYALDAGFLVEDPSAALVAPPRPATDGHPPWTPDDVERFRERWGIGTVPRACMELLHWTGTRISDAVAVGPQHVDRGGVLVFRQIKTREPAFVPWTCPLPAFAAGMLPDRDMMHEAIAPLSGQLTFLSARAGRGAWKARSSKALGTLMLHAAGEAKVECSAHGLRKARAVALAEAGATVHQIAAWTGHKSLSEVQHYTLSASRRAAVMGPAANPPDPFADDDTEAQEIRGASA